MAAVCGASLFFFGLLRACEGTGEIAFTISESSNKSCQKLQIKQSMCNYANAVLTPSVLLTLKGTFAR